MKITIFPFLIFSLCSISCFGQEKAHPKNALMLEAAGPIVAGVGIGYERYFNPTSFFRPTLRSGFGLNNSFQNLTGFIGGSLLWGGTSNIEFGVNYLFNYDHSVFESPDNGSNTDFKNGYQAVLGYRYQSRKGFLARVYWVIPVGCCGSWIPVYSGLSLGYAF